MPQEDITNKVISIRNIALTLAIVIPMVASVVMFVYHEFALRTDLEALSARVGTNTALDDRDKLERQMMFEFERNKIMLVLLETKLKEAYEVPSDKYTLETLIHEKETLSARQTQLRQKFLESVSTAFDESQ